MRLRNLCLGIVTGLALGLNAGSVLAQSTIYVDDDAVPGGDGASWATAFQFLQDALAVAVKDDVLRIAGGTYRPDQGAGQTAGDRMSTFNLRPKRTLEGGYRGLAGGGSPDDRDPDTFQTVLSGDLAGDDMPGFVNYAENSYQVCNASNMQNPVVLDGLTIRGGNADGPSTQLQSGGALYSSNGVITMDDCKVMENMSFEPGGGLCLENSADATVNGSRFEDNMTQRSGGGIYVESATLVVSECEFEDHYANRFGGGIGAYLSSSITVNDSLFTGNDAGIEGGGIRVDESSATVTGCQFVDEDAGSGAGIAVDTGTLEVEECFFTGNVARNHGGAIHSSASTLILRTSQFQGNVCKDGFGGAVDTDGPSFEVSDCTFTNNHTDQNGDGGGLNLGATTGVVLRCRFLQNEAIDGGAIRCSAITVATIEDCEFSENCARSDAGAIMIAAGRIEDCQFVGNQSIDRGGAVWHAFISTTLEVDRCTFWSNRALASSGGAGFRSGDVALLDGNIFWGNVDQNGGGLDAQVGGTGTTTLTYNCIEGWGAPSNGNHGQDPMFVDGLGPDLVAGTDDDDLRLLGASPCVDTGDPLDLPSGTDVAGRPRFLDGDLDRVRIVDQGAQEFSNITLDVTGSFTPGGAATLDSTGTAGLKILLFVGLAPGESDLDPYGVWLFDPTTYVAFFNLGTVPASNGFVIPASTPTPLPLVLQELALDTVSKAGNTSNAVQVTIE